MAGRTGSAASGGSTPANTLGGGGGGWSGIAAGVPDHSSVILVAAGGGGAGNEWGASGGDAGEDGATVGNAGGGGAGTETAGGAGGEGALDGYPGAALTGGAGTNGGGGGGAGYFGGGGGAVYSTNGGGGGGSSFPFAGSPDRLSYAIKGASDPADGWVVIRFDVADANDTCGTPVAHGELSGGQDLDGATVDPGDVFTITGSDWGSGEQLTISFESTPVVLGTITTAADGTFTFSSAVPLGASAGAHSVVVTPAASTLPTLRFAVTVNAVLAATGTEIAAGVAVGAGLLVLGTLLLLPRPARARARLEA